MCTMSYLTLYRVNVTVLARGTNNFIVLSEGIPGSIFLENYVWLKIEAF